MATWNTNTIAFGEHNLVADFFQKQNLDALFVQKWGLGLCEPGCSALNRHIVVKGQGQAHRHHAAIVLHQRWENLHEHFFCH
jgi:hypothetical protein